ncbi:oxidoreductase, short chain dehydrogenase/reductase family protein [Acetobacteraceae bacterium AT-5844]|nr:oxidoreductase, short chain dehydrogenase/reductase family protein [Acetobacteraceae bacterium AT-5844]
MLSLLPLLPLAPLAAPLAVLAVGAFVLSGCGAGGGLSAEQGQRKVAGRVFVVTGASSGLGRGVAVKLGGYGASVVLAARRGAVLEEVAAEVRAAGGQALVVVTDVSDPEAVRRLAEEAVERFGRIDVWVNNAGIGVIGRFEDVPVQDHVRVVDVNLKGVIYGSHAALRQFRVQGHGVLVNVGSVESRLPLPYQASYAATKHAILGLGNALRQELRLAGQTRIQVATVMPWGIDTPWWEVAGNYSGHSPRVRPMDGPEDTVDAVIHAAIWPRREVPVGWKTEGSLLAHQVMPVLVERMGADAYHGNVVSGPPAPDRVGAIYEPMEGVPTGVEGGVRARMAREDAGR